MRNWLGRRLGGVLRWLTATEPRPEIRWGEIVRLEALGTDAVGAFEVSLTFVHADGSEATVFAHTRGYDEIVSSLTRHLPGLSATWFEEMARQPWHVERVLYSRAEDSSGGPA